MNIDDLYTVENHEKGAEMQVKDQHGKPIEMFFTVIGVDSKKWRGLLSKINKIDNNAEDIAPMADVLSDAVIAWRGVESKGKALKFTKATCKKLLINAPYIMGQISNFVVRRSNFTKG